MWGDSSPGETLIWQAMEWALDSTVKTKEYWQRRGLLNVGITVRLS